MINKHPMFPLVCFLRFTNLRARIFVAAGHKTWVKGSIKVKVKVRVGSWVKVEVKVVQWRGVAGRRATSAVENLLMVEYLISK